MRTSSAFGTRMWVFPLLLLSFSRGDRAAVPAGALAPAQPARAAERGEIAQKKLSAAYGKLPISFELNQGQTDGRVRFLSRGAGYSLFLTPTEAVFALKRPATLTGGKDRLAAGMDGRAQVVESRSAVMRMNLVGAKPPSKITGDHPLPGKSNYFIGNNPKNWRRDVPTYARVRYANVYAGVDLVYHGNQGQLEYDFVVAPGADASAIRLAFEGVENIAIDATGDLVLRLAGSEIRQHRPVVYQEVAGVRQGISAGYLLKGDGQVGFEVAEYDPSRPLVIDPVLAYSTYLGGSAREFGQSVAVDASGSAYITGGTASIDFPTTGGAFQTTGGVVVSKLDPAGSTLVYSTYLGGGTVSAIALDDLGNAYLTGGTESADFPTTPGALDRTCQLLPNGACVGKAFVTKVNSSGSALVYSTYLGPSDNVLDTDVAGATGIRVDSEGYAYVVGNTRHNFPTTPGAFQGTYGGGDSDGFVSKLNVAGSALVYSSFLGGSGLEQALGIAIDRSGNAYLAGYTSGDFPTTPGAFQVTCSVYVIGCLVAFVTKIDAPGSALVYSTYLGGASRATGVAVDEFGDTYVTGLAYDGAFPTTPGAFQTTMAGGSDDAFVTKLNSIGTALVYSTYLGGSSYDAGEGIAVDALGNAYVAGWTWSADFPVVNAVQPTLRGTENAFVAKLNSAGSAPHYSTYLGGSFADEAQDIAADSDGNAYVIGLAQSSDFPTANPLQPTLGGVSDMFLAKIGEPLPCPEEFTDRVDITRSRFYRILFTPFRFQWVVIRNKTTDPIQGPLSYVMEDLQNATFLGSRLKTVCLSPSGDPFIVTHPGSDDVLSPDERVLAFLLFFKTHPGHITYMPRVLSGIPTQ